MKTNYLILLILCFSLSYQKGLRCSQLINGEAFYKIDFISTPNNYLHKFSIENTEYELQYNFCKFIHRQCQNTNSYGSAFKLINNSNQTECIRLTSDSQISHYSFNLIDPNNYQKGITYSMTQGQNYDLDSTYQLDINIICNKNVQQFIQTDFQIDKNIYIVTGQSQYGCPVTQISQIYQLIYDSKYFFAILLFVFSIIICFYGLKLLTPLLFLIGYLSGFFFVILIFGEFIISPNINQIVIFACILMAIILGSVIGYLFIKLPKLAYTGMGVWLGIVISFMLNSIFLFQIQTKPENLLLYICMIILGTIFGYLSYKNWQTIAIFNTSFLGAYGIVRSLAVFIGNFPDEINMNKFHKVEGNSDYVYIVVYFVMIIILSILGAYYQIQQKRNDQIEEEKLQNGHIFDMELNDYTQL